MKKTYELEEWFKIYRKIVKELEIDEKKDYEARDLIIELAKGKLLDLKALKRKISGKSVAVIGYAIKKDEFKKIKEDIVITAGKSLAKVKEISRAYVPDIHVTDLEEEELIVELEKKGCLIVVHAHGDNMERIKRIVPKLSKFVATTQVIPKEKVYNFGGFTDGDRAAIIAKKMGAKMIKLYGFDFGNANSTLKRKKLKWARKILEKEKIVT